MKKGSARQWSQCRWVSRMENCSGSSFGTVSWIDMAPVPASTRSRSVGEISISKHVVAPPYRRNFSPLTGTDPRHPCTLTVKPDIDWDHPFDSG